MTGRPAVRVVALCGGMVTFGGAERMMFAVLEALVQSGASVHCILNDWASSAIAAVADRIGATWTTSPYREVLGRQARSPRQAWRLALDLASSHRDLLGAAWRVRPTHVVVSGHDVVLRNLLVLALMRVAGVRVVLKMSNVPDPSPFHRRLWRRWINAGVSTFVCNSRFTQSELLACGVRAGKSLVIHETLPGREPARTAAAPAAGRIVYAGQTIPGKGLHVLLDALGLMVQRGADVSLDVAGEMDGWEAPAYRGYRDGLRERAGLPDLAGRVRFLGWQDNVPAVMSGGVLHCCPSLPELRESFGLVVLEAKSVGVPSVVFRCGALQELVTDGVDGWYADPPTAESLAAVMLGALQRPDALAAAGQAAKRSADRFSVTEFRRRWLDVFVPEPA